MRGGSALFFVSVLAGCSGSEGAKRSEPPARKKVEDPRPDPTKPVAPKKDRKIDDLPRYGTEKARHPSIKGGGEPDVPVNLEGSGPADRLLHLQRQLYAKQPTSDLERLRLSLLYLTRENYPEAERYLALIREKSDLLPYLEAYLYRKLGETQRAEESHRKLEDVWRRAEGFKVERATLVKGVRGYAKYDLETGGKLAPGEAALLYIQPIHYTLKRDGEQYILHLGYEWKLFDDRNREVEVPWWKNANKNDRFDFIKFRSPVREFYQYFRLKLPSNLATGNYRIQITVTDKNASREDRATVPIYVVPTK